ncbi:unnamed protein product [Prunus brigantina]
MALLKCLKWLSGSEFPLSGVMDGVVNRFDSGACSTSSVKGEQSTRSISLRMASSVLPLSWRPWSRSFTSFSISSACRAGDSVRRPRRGSPGMFVRIPLQFVVACWSSSGMVGVVRCTRHAIAHELKLLVGPSEPLAAARLWRSRGHVAAVLQPAAEGGCKALGDGCKVLVATIPCGCIEVSTTKP